MYRFPPQRFPPDFLPLPPFHGPRFPQGNPPPPGFQPGFPPNALARGRGFSGPFPNPGGPSGFQGGGREDNRPHPPRFNAPFRGDRPQFSPRGRGGRGRGNNQQHGNQGGGAFYKHSMVEDPWKELEENLRKKQP